MMKKRTIALLGCCLTLLLTACGGEQAAAGNKLRPTPLRRQ